jgi:hypothetical protein
MGAIFIKLGLAPAIKSIFIDLCIRVIFYKKTTHLIFNKLSEIVLFFFIPAEDADFFEFICFQETTQDSIPEGASAAGNE